MKKMKLLSLLVFIPFFGLTACNKDEPYKNIIKDSTQLIAKNSVTEYKSGTTLDVTKINVTFDGKPVEYEGSQENPVVGKFFITKSNISPTRNRVKQESLQLKISEEKKEQIFYVALLTGTGSEDPVHVSSELKVLITNDKGMKTWVYWVVGPTVIVGASLLVFLTKKYKDKHPN